MKLKSLHIENFNSIVSAEIALDGRGLLLVQGDNQLSSSADSNGSGKSTLLEAILYGLYGKTIRYDLKGGKPTGDLCVNDRFGPNPGRNCCVRQVWDMDGRAVEITRYRKDKTHKNNVYITVDGTDYTRGTAKETDRLICEMIGLDFPSFVRSVYFDGRSIVPFPTLSDGENKAVFEKVLGLDDLQKVCEVVKGRLKDKNAQLVSLGSEQRLEQSQASTAELEKQTAIGQRDDFEAQRKREISDLEGQIGVLEAAPIRPAAEIDADAAELDALEKDLAAKLLNFEGLDQLMQNWAAQKAAKAAEVSQLRTQALQLAASQPSVSGETQQAVWAVQAEYKRIDSELRQAQADSQNASAKIGRPCSECGKPYTQDDLGHIVAHTQKRIADLQSSMRDIQDRMRQLQAKGEAEIEAGRAKLAEQLEAAQMAVSDAEDEVAALDAKGPQFEKLKQMRADLQKQLQGIPASRSALQEQRHARERNDASTAALRARIDELKAKPNPFVDDIERWTQRKAEHLGRVGTIDGQMQALEKDIKMLKVLEEAYGRTGLKAHILETITPILNARANEYAMRLADGSVKIEFSTVTKLRDGTLAERFSVNVTNDQGTDGYLGCSAGEQRKIDLAIALAMSDLVAARSSKSIAFWCADEIAESLDATAVDRVVEVLKQKATERGTVLVISHTPMDDLIPQVVTVRKTSAGSELIDGVAAGW